MDLKETFFVSSFIRNLVSVSYLYKLGYLCSFGNNVFRLFFNLYLLDTITSYGESFNVELCGTKCRIDNTNSGALWHKHLSHISKNKIERLVLNRILDSIDFTSFDVCVECIKGKQTKSKKLGAYRATDVLRYIQTFVGHFIHLHGMINNILYHS